MALKKNESIAYKVVKLSDSKEHVSCFAPQSWTVRYALQLKAKPIEKGSKLFAFARVDAAIAFAVEHGTHLPLEVYKCVITNRIPYKVCSKLKIANGTNNDESVYYDYKVAWKQILNHLRGKDYDYTSSHDMPHGTVLCDSIMLTERIEY